MQLTQSKFIWLGNNVHALKVEQDDTSVVTMHLRPQIDITHDHQRNNRVEIIFKDDGAKFLVKDHDQLSEICRIHLMNKDCVELLRRHCEKYLTKVTE